MSCLRSGRNRLTGSPDKGLSPSNDEVRPSGHTSRNGSSAMATRASSADAKAMAGKAGKVNMFIFMFLTNSNLRTRDYSLLIFLEPRTAGNYPLIFNAFQKIKVEASLVKGIKRQRDAAAPDTDEPERKTMKRPKNQVIWHHDTILLK